MRGWSRRRVSSLASVAALAAAGAVAPGGVRAGEVPEARQVVVAGPLAESAGYANRLVVTTEGGGLDFVNADADVHDVTALLRDAEGDPVFGSETIDLGETAPVEGVEALAPGTYQFYCSIHPNMFGALTVAAQP